MNRKQKGPGCPIPVNLKMVDVNLNLKRVKLIGAALVLVILFSPGAFADNLFIRFYQDHISPIDGARCPMHPTCSAYARQAVEKHGPLIGWIMAMDRLVRCGRDEVRLSRHVIINGRDKVLDPVENNDFWWFQKKDGP